MPHLARQPQACCQAGLRGAFLKLCLERTWRCEMWTKLSLSLSLSLSPSLPLYVCQSLHRSVSLSLSLSLRVCVWVCVCVSLSVTLCLSLSLSLSRSLVCPYVLSRLQSFSGRRCSGWHRQCYSGLFWLSRAPHRPLFLYFSFFFYLISIFCLIFPFCGPIF